MCVINISAFAGVEIIDYHGSSVGGGVLCSRSRRGRHSVRRPASLQTGLANPETAIASNEATRTTFRDTNPEFR
jgi:hypothetical protein